MFNSILGEIDKMKNFSKIAGILVFCLVAVVGMLSGMAAVIPADVMAAAPVLDALGYTIQQPELYLGMSMMVSLPKGVGALRAGGPSDIKDVAYVFRKSDVLFMPTRNANGVLITGSVVMKPGTFMAKLYGTQSLIEVKEMTEGNADQEGSKSSVTLVHPGSYLEVQEWYQANKHEDLFIIIQRCKGEMELYGDCCNGLRVKREKTINGTETSNKFTFEAPIAGDVAAIYRGNITEDAFVGTLAANATTQTLNGGPGRYLAPRHNTNATALASIVNSLPHGFVFTLVGGTGANQPYSIGESGEFLLADITGDLVLNPGVEVTFEVFATVDGGVVTQKRLLERSRFIP